MIAARTSGGFQKPRHYPNFTDRMNPDQVRQLREWLIAENIPYSKAQARLKERFGLSISQGAVASFYKRECGSVVLEREAAKHGFRLEVRAFIGSQPIDLKLYTGPLPPGLAQHITGG